VGTIQGAWIWYEVMTSDAAATRDFYQSVVGWSISEGGEAPIFYGHIARADGREVGGVLPLTPGMIEEGARTAWVGYIGVEDLDATMGAIIAQGGRILAPRMDIDEGSFAMAMDPWGAAFYLMQPKRAGAASVAFGREDVGSVSWNELYAGDFDGALGFYTAVFGWELSGSMDMGAMGTYQMLSHNGVQMGAIMARPPHVPVSAWNHYIRVADIDAAAGAIVAGGGRVLHGPIAVPGGDWSLNAIDPVGAAFALVGRRA
jgi:predicted enzyme related to lactoylglutathione lyase